MSEQQPSKTSLSDVLLGIGSIVVSIVALCLIVWGCIWAWGGISSWFHDITTTSPEEQAAIDKANDEWAKDPTNPEVIAKRCMDMGGIPITSWWDGRVTKCDGTNNKSVNTEVNQ